MAKGDRLPDGTYRVVCASTANGNASLALDVANYGSDERGTNLALQPVSDSDGQYFVAFSRGAEQVLFAPCTGRAVDVEGQRMADGTNVRTWDSWAWNDRDYDGEGHPNVPQVLGQTWDIRDTGATRTIYGIARPVYRVLAHKDNKYCLEVAGTAPKAGDNVQIWTEATADDAGKGWLFVPIATVPDGIYSVRTALDPNYCMSIAGHSTADGANCTVWRWQADANELAFRVQTTAKGITTFESLLRDGQCLNVSGGNGTGDATVADGTRVQWYGGTPGKGAPGNESTGPGRGDYANWWFLRPDNRDCRINGLTYPTFRVVPQCALGKCLDVANGKAELANAFQIYTQNFSYAQAFCLVPAEKYAPSLGAPAAVRGFLSGTTREATSLSTEAATVDVCPSWADGPYSGFDVRYRMRTHEPDGSVGEWGAWRNLGTGSTGNQGWLEVWSSGIAGITTGGGRVRCMSAARVAFKAGETWRDVEFQVRRKSRVGGTMWAHGPAASGIVAVRRIARLDVTGVTLAVSALWVDASMSVESSAVDVTVGDVCEFSELYGVANAPTALMCPYDQLNRVPAEGEALAVTARMWTPDGSTKAVTKRLGVSYVRDPKFNPTVTVLQGPEWVARLSNYPPDTELWLVVRRGTVQRLHRVDPGRIPYPLGADWELFATCSGDSGTGYSGGVWHRRMAAVTPRRGLMLWDFQVPGGAWRQLALAYQADERPSMSQSLSPDAEAHVTAGRERPVYTVGRATKSSLDCSGAVVPTLGLPQSTRALAVQLAHAGRAVYRRPDGLWAKVVVTGVETGDSARDHTPVSVRQSEESRGGEGDGVGLV